jgi:plastocyanin
METGPGGDAWPEVGLASVEFTKPFTWPAMPPTLSVQGEGRALMHPVQLASDLAESSKAFPATPDCKPLAKGHKRRIFFNSIHQGFDRTPIQGFDRAPIESGPETPFGLGYEEIDAKGNPVPGTFVDVAVFNPDRPTICLTLGPGDTPAIERWELINLATEDHNFHIHQVKFSLLTEDEVGGTSVPRGAGVLHDNVPVRYADGFCFSVQDWRNGQCTAHPVTIEVPFTVAGDFVYHCHILEHEDGGMMARIRVRHAQP